MANTPNMNLALPTVSVTAGPAWATQLNTVLGQIDAHNHTSGSGVPVPSAGVNINAALPFNSNDAITLRTVRFTDQTNPLTAPADIGCLYLASGNLFFNSGAGAAVQITSGAALAGTPGSIGGLVSPAAVTYTPASTTFRFTSNTNVNAQLDIAQLTIRQPVAAANGITLQSPTSLAASYSLTLPTALPAAQRILTLDNLGATNFWNIDGTTLVNTSAVLGVQNVTALVTNTSAVIKGNRNAGDTGADVVSNGSATRTAGFIHDFQNNGTSKARVDYTGAAHGPNQWQFTKATTTTNSTTTPVFCTGMSFPATGNVGAVYAFQLFLYVVGPNGVTFALGLSTSGITGPSIQALAVGTPSQTTASPSSLALFGGASTACSTLLTFNVNQSATITVTGTAIIAAQSPSIALYFASGTAGQQVVVYGPQSWMTWARVDGGFD